MGKARQLKNPVAFLCLFITACSITVLILSVTRLPDSTSISGGQFVLRRSQTDLSESDELGVFAKMMIEMLPEDLVFTAFVPSDKAFSRDLGLQPNKSQQAKDQNDEEDNTYAVVSRILGFSVVPYRVEERDVGEYETVSYESLSGFTLYMWKNKGDRLMVNGAETVKKGLKRGKIVVYSMDRVVMDTEFAQSIDSVTDTASDEDK